MVPFVNEEPTEAQVPLTYWEGRSEFCRNGKPAALSGLFALACCGGQNQSIREVTRIAAKNTRGAAVFLCATARPCAEEQFSPAIRFCDKRQLTFAIAQSIGMDLGRAMSKKSREKSTNVYQCRAKMEFFARHSESFIAVSDGYLEDGFRAVNSVCADLRH